MNEVAMTSALRDFCLAQDLPCQSGECDPGQLAQGDPLSLHLLGRRPAPHAHRVVGYRDRVFEREISAVWGALGFWLPPRCGRCDLAGCVGRGFTVYRKTRISRLRG